MYRGEVNFNSPGLVVAGTTPVKIGRLAIGSEILAAKIKVVTPFAGSTTATVSIGTNSPTYNNIIAAVDVTAVGGTTITVAATGLQLDTSTTELDVFMALAQTGAAATAGKVRGFLDVVNYP
jgi:hypothetical protein